MAPEEIQPLAAFPQVNYLRLTRVQPQPQPAEDLSHGAQGRLGPRLAAAQHHAVIGIAHQLTHVPAGELAVQDVQVNVGQQWGNNPPWGVPATARSRPCSVITPACSHKRTSFSTRRSDTRRPTSASSRSWLISPKKFAMSNSTTKRRPEPERARKEIRLEHRLQHDLRRLLRHPVADRRNAERPLAAIWFRDVHAPGGRGTARALAQVSLKFSEHSLNPVLFLHIGQGDTIHPGRSPARPHAAPRLPQDVTL
jgi:hypothetical protein